MRYTRKDEGLPARLPLALALLCFFSLPACDNAVGPEDERIVAGVNLDRLFAAPSEAEVQAVLSEWESRDVSVQDFVVEKDSTLTLGNIPGRLRIVSHTVGGVRHYGAVFVPEGAQAGSLPVLMYNHGGDEGVEIEDLGLILSETGELGDRFVYVVPSFRSEPLQFAGQSYLSEGPPSPWDRDVDDAIALLNAALSHTPEADPERIGLLGFSRGGGVSLLMAARDPRIDLVIEFFGPTDFFGPFVQGVTEDALEGRPRDLPGLNYLNTAFIQPLKEGTLTIEQVRPELVRRSAVLFAERLPPVQVHHGTMDSVVPLSQAEALKAAMERLGRGEPAFEYYTYPGGGHGESLLFGFPVSVERAAAFLSRLLDS